MSTVDYKECESIIRKAIKGEIKVKLHKDQKYDWDYQASGNVRFMFGDNELTFFNDVGEVDYLDNIKLSDGRIGEFLDWYDFRTEFGSSLSLEEEKELERLIRTATHNP